MVIFKIPKHKCGTILEGKNITINEKILSLKEYPVYYCPKCETYMLRIPIPSSELDKYESKNPEMLADWIIDIQAKRNLKNNKTIYNKRYLEKMIKELKLK